MPVASSTVQEGPRLNTMEISVWHVFGVAVISDLATGLGALPFFFVRSMPTRWQGFLYAVAGGMMTSAAVFSLAEQGFARGGAWKTIIGMLAGAGFYWVTTRLIARNDWSIGSLNTRETPQALLILGAMFVHSIPEGIAIGVGYATGQFEFGLLLALAIAAHNIPEGTAVSIPLRAKGVSPLGCLGYAILSSLPQPLAAVPAFLLVDFFQPLLPFGLGFAGGAMIFLVVAELLPEALRSSSRDQVAWGALIGLTMMLLVTAGLGLLTGGF